MKRGGMGYGVTGNVKLVGVKQNGNYLERRMSRKIALSRHSDSPIIEGLPASTSLLVPLELGWTFLPMGKLQRACFAGCQGSWAHDRTLPDRPTHPTNTWRQEGDVRKNELCR